MPQINFNDSLILYLAILLLIPNPCDYSINVCSQTNACTVISGNCYRLM